MPRFLLLLATLLIPYLTLSAQTMLVSWNIRDFGKTKEEHHIRQIAEILRNADLVAIQEVVAGYGGAQAVARLADELNRMGAKWDYRISDPTSSPPYKTERYAFLWKTARVQLVGRPWLERSLPEAVYREPYMGRFRVEGRTVLICNFHARRYDEEPQEEIRLLATLPGMYPGDLLLLAGDFNADEQDPAFNPLYQQGYRPALRKKKTTLKRSCSSGYLANAIDNIYFPYGNVRVESARVVDFVDKCSNLDKARELSDHLPVELVFFQ